MHIYSLRNIIIILLILSITAFILKIWESGSFTLEKSQFYYNGNILTMEDEFPQVEAIFVDHGIIQAVGKANELRLLIQEETKLIDLQGMTMIPGFIDSHTHPLASAFLYNMIDLSGFTHNSVEKLWTHFENSLQIYQPNEWILCKWFDQILVEGLEPPHISYLDSIAPNNPVFIASLSLHSYWANTLAFEAVGIDKNTKNPSESSYYEKDEYGNLTGYIAEQAAFKPFKESMVKSLGNDVLKENCLAVLEEYAENGNTTIISMGITTDDPKIIRLYSHLSSEKTTVLNKLLTKIRLLPLRKPTVRHFVFVRNDASTLLPASIDNGDDFFKMVGIKFWYDGSPYTGSMYIDEPYLENELTNKILHFPKSHSGAALLDQEDLKESIIAYQNEGWQIAVHAQGNKAIREILDTFEAAGEYNDSRHRLEHCLLLEESSTKRMAALNIHPSFHINHLFYYGEVLAEKIIGNERTNQILPLKYAEENLLIYSLHADQPMFASEPLALLHTAVNRKTRDDYSIGKHNIVSVMSGLKALTINAAWQIKMEDKIGSIKVGKYADLVILNQNPLEIPVSDIRNIQINRTIVNGNTIFSK